MESKDMTEKNEISIACAEDDSTVHTDIIAAAAESFPDEETMCDIAELFKIFGDTTRIKILYALAESEMAVCDIAVLLSMTQSAISHQLRVLKQSRLIKFRRDGKSMIYSLADEHVRCILNMGLEHLGE